MTLVVVLPLFLAAMSPLLAWRQPVYIAAGLAGIIAMALMVLQPLAARGHLPGLSFGTSRKLHRNLAWVILAGIAAHVIGLWITSPPDVTDALLFISPTPFSTWGVLAMWAAPAGFTSPHLCPFQGP
ncbi:MAG: ferric reductase, partial [Pseudomonadota bacterium]